MTVSRPRWLSMHGLRRSVGPAFLGMVVLLLAASAQAQLQTKGQQRCSATFDKGLAKVAKGFAKDAQKCIKRGDSAQTCVASGPATAKAIDKLPGQVDKKCAETPSFGFTSPLAGMYVRDEGLAMISEIFGPNLDAVVPSACASAVAKGAGKLLALKWKAASKVKKAGLKATIDSAQALASAVDFGVQNDVKVQKAAFKLGITMEKKCTDVSIPSAFPGSCSNESTVADLATCIDEVAECRFCLGYNRTQGTMIDCDLFDDGQANLSCVANGGKGKATAAGVTYHCLGFEGDVADRGSPFSYVTDAVVLDAGPSQIVLAGTATGDLAERGVLEAPIQGAAASLETGPLTLQPFDVCTSVARSLLNSVVTGAHQTDPRATGVADVEFLVHYAATLELESLVAPADFVAFTEITLEVPGLASASFTVSSDGEVTQVPEGLVVEDRSEGDLRVYVVTGTYVVPGQLSYGPNATNVVKTTLLAGGETAEVRVAGGRVVAGSAGVDAIDSLEYEIHSLDPNVVFRFALEAPTPAP